MKRRTRGRWLGTLLLVTILMCNGAPHGFAANDQVAMVLHAVPDSPLATCTRPQEQGFSCQQATTNVLPQTEVDVYVYLVDADSVAGVALRVDWHSSWVFHGWHANCQAGTVAAVNPEHTGDSYVAAFNCVVPEGEGLIPIGWFSFLSGNAGTFLTVGQAQGGGTGVVDCMIHAAPIPSNRWGSIGVSTPGIDGCNVSPGGWEGDGLTN